MAKVSRTTAAHVDELPIGKDIHDELEGYTVNFVTLEVEGDLAPLLAGLPNDQCACPHWGYMVKGTQTVNYGDRVEVFEAGDAFYMPPGHTPKASAGSEFIVFSPTKELAVTEDHMAKKMAELMGQPS